MQKKFIRGWLNNSILMVLIDTTAIAPRKVGVRVYVRQLLEAIPTDQRCSIRLVCTKSNVHLYEDLEGYQVTLIPWSIPNRFARALTQQIAIPLLTLWWCPDVVLEPVDHAALLAMAPVVTSVHSGPINLKYGQMSGLRKWYNRFLLPLSIWRSEKIIAISAYVKKELADQYRVSPECIEVIHHGGGLVEKAQQNGWEAPNTDERNGGILFVSSLHPHKNADFLLRSYARLHTQMDDPPELVFAGKDVDGQSARLRSLAQSEGIDSYVRFEGRVSDERLLELFQEARLMVYPSSLEGFGIPAVEAMKAGVPLITSDRASLPEVVGEGGRTVAIDDPDILASAMYDVLTDPGERKGLAAAGQSRGRQFSWQKTARKTLNILNRVGGGKMIG